MASGGILYHARAWRRAATEWLPFTEWVRTRLEAWAPTERRLVVFGPSAGYTLPVDWLARFDRVTCIEPDALARILLRKRHPNTKIEFIAATNALPRLGSKNDVSGLINAIDGRGAILFANVLGQMPFIANDPCELWPQTLLNAMRGRTWATYHDLLSIEAPIAPRSALDSALLAPRASHEWSQFAEREWPQRQSLAPLEIRDHGCADLTAEMATPASWWQLTPRNWHLIAWRSSN